MKKIFLVAVAALSLSLVSCGGKKNEENKDENKGQKEPDSSMNEGNSSSNDEDANFNDSNADDVNFEGAYFEAVVNDAGKTTDEKFLVICNQTAKLLNGAKSVEEVEAIMNTTGDAIQALQKLDPKYVPNAEVQEALMNLMTACSEAVNKFEASDEVIDDFFGDFDEDEEGYDEDEEEEDFDEE